MFKRGPICGTEGPAPDLLPCDAVVRLNTNERSGMRGLRFLVALRDRATPDAERAS